MINKLNVNWIDRDSRKEQADKHTETMNAKYCEEINKSVESAVMYNVFKTDDTHWSEEVHVNTMIEPINKVYKTEIEVTTADSVNAIMTHRIQSLDKCAVLNFASFTNPGGKFLQGSYAQEEALCHNSTLYNVLIQFNDTFYENNRTCKEKGLYHSNVLYTPNILFTNNMEEAKAVCDVITCAAPFTRIIMRYKYFSYTECLIAMMQRIDHILDVAYKNQVEKLILGAFGCGVFGNNPTDTAAIFMTLLMSKYKGIFKNVEFAIPMGINNDNNEKFDEVVRTFLAYDFNIKIALSKYKLVESIIGDRPWLN